MPPIIFYDIASDKVGCWSASTWKIRYALNYKGLPFQTIWVEYPDIEAKCKEIGAEPTGTRDGKPLYTFPVIHDPSTAHIISDSQKISQYLDEAYPDTPKLFPEGSQAKQTHIFKELVQNAPRWRLLVMPVMIHILNDASKPYFRTTREKMLGGKLEEVTPRGGERAATMNALKATFTTFMARLDESGRDTPYLLGAAPCYVDFVVASFLQWVKLSMGEDGDVWTAIRELEDGRLIKYLEDLSAYEGNPKA
ncbi:hypothetical protein BD626DRAFT_505495 [Schizophyllum amplum]|uniref:GST N-terminal domain-containing protein n=1 Tax=Schizophyllum amplum TaxID=97359 RepID=A0A550C6R2_9AGAR|nr:hypothetical protein BD626DRAFT_505495 [Auriculariopsis ampla]